MLHPTTDTAKNAMLKTIVHGVVSVSVVAAAVILACLRVITDAETVALIGAGISASGAVSILQEKATNGHVTEEALAQLQRPGGRRRTDPELERKSHAQHPKA